VVVAITNEKPEEARPFLKEHPFPFPVLHDEGGKIGKTYDVTGIPVTAVVGRDGRLVRILQGFEEASFQKEIVSRVVPLLNP
jgi:peroxiredoxin